MSVEHTVRGPEVLHNFNTLGSLLFYIHYMNKLKCVNCLSRIILPILSLENKKDIYCSCMH